MTGLTQVEMMRQIEEHLGINCMEYTHLTTQQRMLIAMFEITRHIPKHTGPKKGEAHKPTKDGIIIP